MAHSSLMLTDILCDQISYVYNKNILSILLKRSDTMVCVEDERYYVAHI